MPSQVWITPGQAHFFGALSNMGSQAFTSGEVGPNRSSRLDRTPYVLALAGLVALLGLASLPLLACHEMRVLAHHGCLCSWRPALHCALVTQR